MSSEAIATPAFRVEHMNEALVDEAIKKFGVKGIPRGAKFANRAGLLQIHLRNITNPDNFVECDLCLAGSDVDLPGCPFCGRGDDEAGVPEKPKEPQKLTQVKRPKQSKPSTEIVKKPEPKTEPAQKADLTVDEGNLLRQLDEAVRDILALNAGVEASKWLLGKKIAEVFHSEGWRLRRDQEGEQSYRGFNQFVVTEIGIDPSTAYRYMDISKRFTEEQAKKLGTHKVVALLRVSDEAEQKKLIEKIEREGLSSREVQAEVKRLNLPRRETGRREMPDGAPGRRALPAGAIAAALTLGVKNLGLMKRDDPTQKAKAIVDLPTCRLDLDNGVVMEFTILEGSAGLVLKVDVKKEDPLSEV